jgi:hypothetical protein
VPRTSVNLRPTTRLWLGPTSGSFEIFTCGAILGRSGHHSGTTHDQKLGAATRNGSLSSTTSCIGLRQAELLPRHRGQVKLIKLTGISATFSLVTVSGTTCLSISKTYSSVPPSLAAPRRLFRGSAVFHVAASKTVFETEPLSQPFRVRLYMCPVAGCSFLSASTR